ncbi:MAG: LapA family protein [Desulfobacteraceae bacterium]|nr:LapA family protein [Desulfobacteraceae bacterium]
MKNVKVILVILFLLLVVILAVQNYDALATPVTFKVNLGFFNYETSQMPLSLIAIITFLIGVLASGLYGITERLRLKRQIKSLMRDVREKDKELNSLRNLPVTTEGASTDQLRET